MKTELWQRVETLFHQVLEIDEDQREAWLQAAARGDPELLREVKDLLSSYSAPGSFMEDPVFAQGLQVLGIDDQKMPFGKFGRYEIIKRIGIGGMGEVFLAHDPALNRQVAVKLLPTHVTDDPQRVRRFQQEAHAASTISHPNVAHIYEIGVEGNRYFTSMEFVEGRTLREVLNQGPLTVQEALKIALEVGRALESAHASGVIHRDIKPENIMIRPDGYVKVLDFGLAKLHRMGDSDDLQATTLVLTEPGLIMGSPAYMSPEQARGFDVDARADIWSLGVVLYEMLCGATPFSGATRMDVFVALLSDEPTPISLSLRHAHPGVRKLLKRMLAKDIDHRYRTSTEVVADLQHLIRDMRLSVKHRKLTMFQGSRLALLKHQALEVYRSSEGTIIRTPLPFFIATIVAGIALTWPIKNFQPHRALTTDSVSEKYSPEQPPSSRHLGTTGIAWTTDSKLVLASNIYGNHEIWTMDADGSNQRQVTFNGRTNAEPVLSPDGLFIVYVTYEGRHPHLWRLNSDGTNPKQLTSGGDEDLPRFTPDGKWIVYHSIDRGEYSIRKVSIDGGEPVTLVSEWSTQPDVSPDGKQVACFARREGTATWEILVVPIEGGAPIKKFPLPATVEPEWPGLRWTPDGKELTYVSTVQGVSNVWRQDLKGGEPKPVTDFKENQIVFFDWSRNKRKLVLVR